MSYTGLIATRCRTMRTSNANQRIMARSAHIATDNITALRAVFANFRISTSASGELNNGGSATVTASIEYPADTFTQITFDTGSTSGSIAAGGIIISDSMSISIPSGDTFWIRVFFVNTSGTMHNAWRNAGLGEVLNAGNALSDQTMGGTISSAGNFSHPPLAILGSTTKRSVILICDSIGYGTTDTDPNVDGRMGIVAKSFPADMAFLNLGSAGSRANLYMTESASRQLLWPYCSHFVSQLGRNDIYVSSNSAATLLTNLQTIWTAMKAANPTAKIMQTMITHTTTSTDSWATDSVANGGQQTASVRESVRLTFNSTIRAGGVSGLDNGFWEVSRPMETSNDSGFWKFDGTANKWTADGFHPSAFAFDAVVTSGAVDMSLIQDPPSSGSGGARQLLLMDVG